MENKIREKIDRLETIADILDHLNNRANNIKSDMGYYEESEDFESCTWKKDTVEKYKAQLKAIDTVAKEIEKLA